MRTPEEQQIALDCLRLVFEPNTYRVEEAIEAAERCFAFVTGAGADEAKAKLAAVRKVIA